MRKKKFGSSASVTLLSPGEKYICKIDVANKACDQKIIVSVNLEMT